MNADADYELLCGRSTDGAPYTTIITERTAQAAMDYAAHKLGHVVMAWRLYTPPRPWNTLPTPYGHGRAS